MTHDLHDEPAPPHGETASRLHRLAAGALIVAAVVIAATLAWREERSSPRPSPPAAAVVSAPQPTAGPQPTSVPQPPAAPATIGAIDTPAREGVIGTSLHLSGWALARNGIRGVEVRIDGKAYPARYGIARADVAREKPGFPDAAASGFAFDGDFADLSLERHVASVVAIDRSGRETLLGARGLVPPAALVEWRPLYEQRRAQRIAPFYIVPALSGIALGGASELDAAYREYLSPTFRTGMRVPILYLRTTLGAAKDWALDPDWDIERKCGDRRIAEDSLSTVLRYSLQHRLPVLFTLNGGVWADAGCDVPDWDVNDHLEQDPANCQWNEKNEVMPDDYLRHLTGSMDSPELARSLTFNVYAKANRHYKRRNLQAAGRRVMAFARAHPELFIGIALDADTYMNPFFDEKQWYDYNPGTLRQFREWLSGTGAYARHPAAGSPDLSRYRREHPLSLAEVNRLAGKSWRSWDEVDPPRAFPSDGRRPFWEDPWTHEWEVFRRHLVHLHYNDLAHWLVEVGVPKAKIFSSQGFIAPYPTAMPFALHVDSPSKNYDTGGMSVEGAIPRDGHLGAIVYGESAWNDIRVEGGGNLFATFHRMDPGWAVGEFNTADFRHPKDLPGYAMGYRTLREMFNYGARFASPMAWNGSNGVNAGKPGYVSFTAWRNTPLEEALRDFAVAHAYVPVGTRLWTFGSAQHADGDGWSAATGALAPGDGYVEVTPANGTVTLLSPAPLALGRSESDLLVVGADPRAVDSVAVEARSAAGAWRPLGPKRSASRLSTTPAGISVPLAWPQGLAATDRIRIALGLRSAARIRHLALYPRVAP